MNVRWFGWLAMLCALAFGCGPGFQAIYESDARFEHCYALDENPNVLMQQKSDCWGDWIKGYTYGQTRDRVEYAATRYRAITRIHTAPTDEALMSAAPGEAAQTSSITAPAPTSAFAPPPKTMDAPLDAGSPPESFSSPQGGNAQEPRARRPPAEPAQATPASPPPPSVEAPRAPGADCTEGCWSTWQKCRDGCKEKMCGLCDKSYGRCVKACF
jgi:hypothetical protein